ncbi:MAG: ABC transporter substrate-binding protein, partial [Niameybacter sp.]
IAQIGHGAHALCIEGEAEIFAMDALSLSDAVIANTEKGIQSIEDLKGKKVAVQAGTSSEIILNLALERVEMSQSDIEIIQMEASGMVSAMISGGIDACATWEPSSTTIRAQMGDKALTLASNADFLEEATFPSSFITTEKYADTNRDILVRFAMGLLKAQDYRNSNIEEVCKTVAKQIEADEATILETKSGAKWLTGEEIKGYVADGTIKTYYESQQQVFIKDGRITDVVPVEEYVMFDIFEEAVANYK